MSCSCYECEFLGGCEEARASVKTATLRSRLEFLEQSVSKLESQLKVAVGALELAERRLDGIKYELEASIYTLEDDEFETVFFVRDCAIEALAKIRGGGA